MSHSAMPPTGLIVPNRYTTSPQPDFLEDGGCASDRGDLRQAPKPEGAISLMAMMKGRELPLIKAKTAVVGRTQSFDSRKFLRVPTGGQWWLSATAAAFQCPDFRTHNPNVVSLNPTPATNSINHLRDFDRNPQVQIRPKAPR